MKRALLTFLCALAGLGSALPRVQAATDAPRITGLRAADNMLHVSVELPSGARRVTLETRPRLAQGSWTPRRVEWVDGTPGIREWSVPMEGDSVLVRIRQETDDELPLPAAFYGGTNGFSPLLSTNVQPPVVFLGPGDATADGRGAEDTSTREVAESDIWRLEGSLLYFFNATRGLQVIDLADPDQPSLVATLPLVGRGEQMYLLPSTDGSPVRWLALLTQDDCGGTASTVHLVRHEGATLTATAALPVTGMLRESRLVGTALYLASADSYARPAQTTTNANGVVSVTVAEWRTDTVLTGFDLSDPAQPAGPDVRRLPAAPDAINATPEALWVAVTEEDPAPPETPWYLRTRTYRVHRFDITDPTGILAPAGTATVRGRVADKFKLHQDGDILTVVSQQDGLWRPAGDPSLGWVFVPPKTWLETFDWSGPAGTPLGVLKLVENESLFATRFLGKRAYVVTFRQIDPLWIVDLSDPARPQVKGELQIPGYSSYLEPIGTDRLVAMGVDSGNATVALFDVSDDANPRQITKVFLGSGWSWSEANSDEKAFRVFPDRQMALVPWQGWDGDTWTQAVQLLDLSPDTLAARGVIHHTLQARRATLLGDRIVSVSSRELLSVDFTDRDTPAITGTLELGYRVDRVARLGNRLLQVSQDTRAGTAAEAVTEVRLAPAAAPAEPTGRLELPGGQVVGLHLTGSTAHLLQFVSDRWEQVPTVTWKEEVRETPDGPVTLRIATTNWVSQVVPGWLEATGIDCSGDHPVRMGSLRMDLPEEYWGEAMEGFETAPGTLVWTERRGTAAWGPWRYWEPFLAVDAIRPAAGFWWPGSSRNRNLLALDLATPTAPVLASATRLDVGDNGQHSGRAFVADGRLHLSHRETKVVPPATKPDSPAPNPDAAGTVAPVLWEPQVLETRHLLDVVDFHDIRSPVIRPALSVPGEVIGVGFGGALLITSGDTQWDTNGIPSRALHALAYDGVDARLVAEVPGDGVDSWTVLGDAAVAGFHPGRDNSGTSDAPSLEIWSLDTGGSWTAGSPLPLEPGSYEIQRKGDLLVTGNGSLFEFHRIHPTGTLEHLGRTGRPCSWWFDWNHVDGSAEDGLWIPLGDPGLEHLVPAP